MEKRNIQISREKAIEWYNQGGELREMALQAFTEDELKDNRSRSWGEYLRKNMGLNTGYCLQGNVPGVCAAHLNELLPVYPTKEYAEAALALSKLLQLRQEWVKDWKPNWIDPHTKYVIENVRNELVVTAIIHACSSMSFSTREMAEEFLDCFKDLLEKAKILL